MQDFTDHSDAVDPCRPLIVKHISAQESRQKAGKNGGDRTGELGIGPRQTPEGSQIAEHTAHDPCDDTGRSAEDQAGAQGRCIPYVDHGAADIDPACRRAGIHGQTAERYPADDLLCPA